MRGIVRLNLNLDNRQSEKLRTHNRERGGGGGLARHTTPIKEKKHDICKKIYKYADMYIYN